LDRSQFVTTEMADQPRPLSRAYHPVYDANVRRAAGEFLRAKDGHLRAPYAVLCVVHFVHRILGRPVVCGADVRALFPTPQTDIAGPLRNAHDILRRGAARGLVGAVGDGRYRITPLGNAVVDALPDAGRVAALRGCRTVSCAMGRPRLA